MTNYSVIADELKQRQAWLRASIDQEHDPVGISLLVERKLMLDSYVAEWDVEKTTIRAMRDLANKYDILDWPAISGLTDSDIPDFLRMHQLLVQHTLLTPVKNPPAYHADMSFGWFHETTALPAVSKCLDIYRGRHSDSAFVLALTMLSHEFLSDQVSLLAKLPQRRVERILAGVARAREAGLLPNGLRLRGEPGLKILYIMGTVSEGTFWPLVFGLKRKGVTQPGDLNWQYLRQSKRSPALRLACLPRVQQWERLFGGKPPHSQYMPSPLGLKLSAIKRLAAEFDVPLTRSKGRHSAEAIATITPLFNLVRLFGDAHHVKQFMTKRGYPMTRVGLHDAGQFTMPREALARPDHWRSLCLRAPTAVAWVSSFRQLEQNGVFPTTVAELEEAVVRIQFKNIPEHQLPLARLCASAKLSRDVFNRYTEFWATVEVKPKDLMPNVVISGSSVGLSADWTFAKLAPTDPRGPMLGHFTGCCQHLTGAGSACARHGVESPYSGFYVITYRGRIMAQSWAWLDRNGNFVFDSIETIQRERLSEITVLYNAAATQIAEQLKAGVFLGDTSFGHGASIIPGDRKAAVYIQQPADVCDYMDGTNQWHWTGAIRGRNRKVPRVTGYRPNRGLDPQALARANMDMLWLDMMQDRAEWAHEATNDFELRHLI